MYIKQEAQSLMISTEHLDKIGRHTRSREQELFFAREEEIINHLFQSEKEKAQQVARSIIECIVKSGENQSFDVTKYYLITLSSIIARHFERNFGAADKAYALNLTCFKLIDSKLNSNNHIEIMDELIELYIHVIMDKRKPMLLHSTVNNVLLYINERVKSAVTVEEIARHFSISTSHLSRIFREHAGVTLVEYINIRKVEEAQYVLRFSDKQIADISDQFYFCNQSYFTRIFKKYTGQTPKRFRSGRTGEYFSFTLPGEEKQS